MGPPSQSLQPVDYFAIGAGLTGWTTIYVGLRYYTRYVHRIPLGLDDLWCGLAYLLLIGLNIATGFLYLDPNGLKEVDGNLQAKDIRMALTAYYSNHIMYFVCMLFCKLSVIFLCLRLFTSKPFRISAGVVAFFCVAAFIGGLVPFAKDCTPDTIINMYEDMQDSGMDMGSTNMDTCENMVPLFEGVNLSNFFTNLMCLCLPLPWVWGLNVTVKQRIALSVVFLMGGVGCLISFLRVFLQNTWNDSFNTMIGNCSMWSIIEPAICLFAACLPALRPLLPTKVAGPVRNYHSSGNGTDSSMRKGNMASPPPAYNEERRWAQNNPNIGYSQNYYPPPPPSHTTAPASDTRSISQRALGGVRKSWNRNNSFRRDARTALQPQEAVMRQSLQVPGQARRQPYRRHAPPPPMIPPFQLEGIPQSPMQPPQQSQQRQHLDRAQQWFNRRPSLSSKHGRSWLSDEPNTPPQSYYERQNDRYGEFDRGNTF